MKAKQRTIAQSVSLQGVGLHTGADVRITIGPSENGAITFVRTDLDGSPEIKAQVQYVVDTSRGTTIGQNGATVSTIEHVMAALYALGIDNAEIAIDGPECPILDGSSKPILEAIAAVGTRELEAEKEVLQFTENFEFTDEKSGASYLVVPAECTSYTVMIDYRSRVLAPATCYAKRAVFFRK
jgi:UDP-3-O-[3-hydroxymyristoyl] N-acetylglucosamine deacetylase/3-hydroxyacyl-[acyl-carrier-protein] dehydratase